MSGVLSVVITGLDPVIHVLSGDREGGVVRMDGRIKSGHDGSGLSGV